MLRWGVFGLGALGAILTFLGWEENWRAARDLARSEQELRNAGEKLELQELLAPPVPEAENFAAAPIVVQLLRVAAQADDRKLTPEEQRLATVSLIPKPSRPGLPDRGAWELGRPLDLAKWATYLEGSAHSPNDAERVLAALARFEPELSEFAAAAARPAAAFPAHYEAGLQFDAHHFFVLTRYSGIFVLRGVAELQNGRADLAFADLRTIFRLQASLRHEPILVALLVRLVLFHDFAQLLWEGLATHAWNVGQLHETEELLGQENWIADYAQTIRGERAFVRICFAQMRRSDDWLATMQAQQPWDVFPRRLSWLLKVMGGEAVLDRNEAEEERDLQQLLGAVDIDARKIFPDRIARLERASKERITTPYNLFAKLALSIHPPILLRTATGEVAIREARTACALERFRLVNGTMPRDAGGLLPGDPMSAGSLRLITAADGSYRLYSLGWNQTDERGEIATKSGGTRRNDEKGDWVWFGDSIGKNSPP